MGLLIWFRHFIILTLLAIILSLPFEPVNNRGTKACLIDGPQPQFPRPIALTKKCQWVNARFKGSWFADSKSCFNRYSHAEEPFGITEDSFS